MLPYDKSSHSGEHRLLERLIKSSLFEKLCPWLLIRPMFSQRDSPRANCPSAETNNGDDAKMTDVRKQTSTQTSRRKTKSAGTKYVDHTYHDYRHVNDKILSWSDTSTSLQSKVDGLKGGGVDVLFPVRLHVMLSMAKSESFDHIFSWQPHGRCFKVHDAAKFVNDVMPRWFKQTKLRSFHRQLNLYGFSRLTKGPDRGAYYNEMFLRGHLELCSRMMRTCVKGTGVRPATSPATEPNFYKMTPCFDVESNNGGKKGTTIDRTTSSTFGFPSSSPEMPSRVPNNILGGRNNLPSRPMTLFDMSKGLSMTPPSEPHGTCFIEERRRNDAFNPYWMVSVKDSLEAVPHNTSGFQSPRSVADGQEMIFNFLGSELDLFVLKLSESDNYEDEDTSDEMEFEGHRFHYLDPNLLRW